MEINLGNSVPVFAHDVALSTITKANRTKKGLRKETFTELVFIDSIKKSAIARIMLPTGVLESLPGLIEENLKKIKQEMSDTKLPKEFIEMEKAIKKAEKEEKKKKSGKGGSGSSRYGNGIELNTVGGAESYVG